MPTKKQIKQSNVLNFLKLKRNGWTFEMIGKKYNVHHTAICYHLKKLGLKYPQNKKGIKKGTLMKKQKYQRKLVVEPKNRYADYLRIDEERKKRCSQNKHLFFI